MSSYKVALIGDRGVGKSSLINMGCAWRTPPHTTTEKADFKTKRVEQETFYMWDTPCEQSDDVKNVVQRADAVWIVCDLSATSDAFRASLRAWLEFVREWNASQPSVVVRIVATKSDVRCVSREEAEAIAKEVGLPFSETFVALEEGDKAAIDESVASIDAALLVSVPPPKVYTKEEMEERRKHLEEILISEKVEGGEVRVLTMLNTMSGRRPWSRCTQQ
jgi:small GTP-binding protein